jgi:hypothetical protein
VKIRANLFLSLFSSLYFILSVFIFSFSYALEILGMLFILSFLINVLIFRDTHIYDGDVVVSKNEEGGEKFSLQLNETPSELAQRNSISFKVVLQKEDQNS